MPDFLQKQVETDYETTVKRVQDALEAEGFSVMLTKGIHDIFEKKLNLTDYPKRTVILGCAAPLAKMALDVSVHVGQLMPCSFYVYEEDGKVFVSHTSIMKAAVKLDLAPEDKMQPVIEETGKRIRRVWDRI